MDENKLKEILNKHKAWLRGEDGGEQAYLSGAYLNGAHLSGADLRWADLSGADLSGADLVRAGLSGANLVGANLSRADLVGADLRRVDLTGADLTGADLRGVDLTGADLRGADLSGADLSGADLSGADLSGADLVGAKNLFLPIACPDTGEFTAWKKCAGSTIVKLLIPADAKRSSATSRKCRASKAVVIAVYDKDGNEIDRAVSNFSNTFVYHKGKTVEPANGFDDNRWNECAPGIHFFITREEAENY